MKSVIGLGLAVLLAGAGVGSYFLFRPVPRQGQEMNLLVAIDPASQSTVVLVNDSGKACKATLEGESPGVKVNLTYALSADHSQSTQQIPGPFRVHRVTTEIEGKSTATESEATIPAGKSATIRVGKEGEVAISPGTG